MKMLYAKPALAAVLLMSAAPLAAQEYCTAPGELVTEDAAGDAAIVAAPDPVPGHDIGTVHFAEPAAIGSGEPLVITLKVDTLSPAPPPNTVYYVYFTLDDGVERYVTYDADPVVGATGNPFAYGHVEPDPTTGVGNLTEDGELDPSSNAAADGTITFVLPKDRISTLSDVGTFISNIYGDARLLVGAAGTGLVSPVDSSPAGVYDIRGRGACSGKSGLLGAGSPAPVLVLLLALAGLARRR